MAGKKPMKIGETRITMHKIRGKHRKVRITKIAKGKYRVKMFKTKKRQAKYHGFASRKVYLAFKEHWKKKKAKKKKMVSIELETAEKLKEAAETMKGMQIPKGLELETAKKLKEAAEAMKGMDIPKRAAAISQQPVPQQTRYVESLDNKIERVKQMLKHLDFEYMKRHISPEEYNRRKFEYLEALRFLKSQKSAKEKARTAKKEPEPKSAVAQPDQPA